MWISTKVKTIIKELRKWAKSFSSMQQEFADSNSVISLLDDVEFFVVLTTRESTPRKSIKSHLANFLKKQLAYWKKR
jgi:hypothetical protein